MSPEDVRLVVAGSDEFRWSAGFPWPLPNGGPPACRPAYAIDDETAIKVVDGTVEVVSEGHWKLFTRSAVATESGY
jgi:hypothetical protein